MGVPQIELRFAKQNSAWHKVSAAQVLFITSIVLGGKTNAETAGF